jgi:hypothetical protein
MAASHSLVSWMVVSKTGSPVLISQLLHRSFLPGSTTVGFDPHQRPALAQWFIEAVQQES